MRRSVRFHGNLAWSGWRAVTSPSVQMYCSGSAARWGAGATGRLRVGSKKSCARAVVTIAAARTKNTRICLGLSMGHGTANGIANSKPLGYKEEFLRRDGRVAIGRSLVAAAALLALGRCR